MNVFLHLHESGQADHHRHHQGGDDVDQGPDEEMNMKLRIYNKKQYDG